MTFNPDLHHRRSIRLQGYDYARSGAYFVTICAWQRECLFGEVVDGVMWLNEAGLTVQQIWVGLPGHFRHVELDQFIVMPNHVHGIILLTAGNGSVGAKQGSSASPVSGVVDQNQGEAGEAFASPLPNPLVNGTASDSLGALIQNFKSVSTRRINLLRCSPGTPVWQRNYYERIIRDDSELERTQQYIEDNPFKWAEDENNPGQPGKLLCPRNV